jgi:hypothetical protein
MFGSTRICTTNKPICKDLYPQIEKGVLELVLTFIRAGFFTISSCEGHRKLENQWRYVTLAFPKRWMAERFLRLEPPSGVFFEETLWSDSYYMSSELPDGVYKMRGEHFSSKTEGFQVSERCKKLFKVDSNDWVLVQVSVYPITERPTNLYEVWMSALCRHFPSFFYKFFEYQSTKRLIKWLKALE